MGEQVTVTWYLYVAEPPSNFQPITQPRTDGFWTEELPSTNPQGRLAFTDQVEGGQQYQAAVLLSSALFPLAPGKLTVTPMEAEIATADFFGRPVAPAPPEVRAARDRGGRAARVKGSRRGSRRERRPLHVSTSRSIARRSRWATR